MDFPGSGDVSQLLAPISTAVQLMKLRGDRFVKERQAHDREASRDAGFEMHLTKPVAMRDLLAAIR